ncbi:hypothetical protein MRX96_040070 [Rhipicephalus microplus]
MASMVHVQVSAKCPYNTIHCLQWSELGAYDHREPLLSLQRAQELRLDVTSETLASSLLVSAYPQCNVPVFRIRDIISDFLWVPRRQHGGRHQGQVNPTGGVCSIVRRL